MAASMNEIMKALHRRKSVRVFTEEDISMEDKRSIAVCGLPVIIYHSGYNRPV